MKPKEEEEEEEEEPNTETMVRLDNAQVVRPASRLRASDLVLR